jgi:hypothetical protein
MKRIISVRLTAAEGEPLNQFFRGTDRTVKTKILNLLERNPGREFDFLVDEDGQKSIKFAGDLVGEVVNIIDDTCIAEFEEDEDGEIVINFSTFEGALPRESTVKQLKDLRKKTKGVDIGDRISDMSKQGANIAYIHNAIDKGVESIEDYWRGNKKFKPNKNLKALKSFKDFK